MSALLFLTEEDFHVVQGQKGPILCNNVNGISICLFYSNNCVHCHKLVPIFKSLVGTITNCQFSMVNVGQQKRVVQMSQNTITPIRFVPYIILYVKSKPYMRYSGSYDLSEIRRFIVEITKNLMTKQKFAGEQKTTEHDTIPEYSLGVPKTCNDGVCYLDFDEAYEK